MKLLVSVVDVDEAVEAYRGGADIIDVKNPSEGSLGANFPWMMKKIKSSLPNKAVLSATIGDLPNLPGTASYAALGAALSGADYVKVGLFESRSPSDSLFLMKMLCRSVGEFCSEVKVIACGYGDYLSFEGLEPTYLPYIASRSGAQGILIDVKVKGERKLFDYMRLDELKEITDEAHRYDLTVAFAGGLASEDVMVVKELGADIIGVRRAVCRSRSAKYSKVNIELVKSLADTIHNKKGIEKNFK